MAPDLDPDRGSKWTRLRPNVVYPGGFGSGSATLVCKQGLYFGLISQKFCTLDSDFKSEKMGTQVFIAMLQSINEINKNIVNTEVEGKGKE